MPKRRCRGGVVLGGRFWGSVFGRGVFGGLVLAGRVGGVVLSGAGWADLGLRVAWRGDLRLWAADLGFGSGWRPAAFLGPVWRLWRIVKMGKGSDVIWGALVGGLLVVAGRGGPGGGSAVAILAAWSGWCTFVRGCGGERLSVQRRWDPGGGRAGGGRATVAVVVGQGCRRVWLWCVWVILVGDLAQLDRRVIGVATLRPAFPPELDRRGGDANRDKTYLLGRCVESEQRTRGPALDGAEGQRPGTLGL